jgi:Cu/Ag efflux pump CusA
VLIGMLLLLQASFGSWRLALAALLTLPMALAGGVLAAYLAGGVLSLGSLFGLLTILAIAVRNEVVLVNRYHQLELHEGGIFGRELAVRGANQRMAPVLMTALTTAVALVSLAISGGGAGYEILGPMAVVILGGLVTATVLNLFVVPALYLRFGSSVELDKTAILFSEQPSLSVSAD